MGLTTVLETETGQEIATVEDPQNLLHRVLPASGETEFTFANTIDWYGDTTFNRAQAHRLRGEWERLLGMVHDAETVTLLRNIDDLLERCESEPHLYIKFYGD